jgi:hypothetical protein
MGLGSAAALAACGGRSASIGGRALIPPNGNSSGFDPSAYFRVVRTRTSSLRKTSAYTYATPIPSGVPSYRDPLEFTTTIGNGSGAGVMYGADGTTVMSVSTSPLPNGAGASISVTLADGSQYTSAMPPLTAFAAQGTSTFGALTMNANQPGGVYTATVQTAGGIASVSTQATTGGYLLTLPDGTTTVLPQAAVVAAGWAPASTAAMSHMRHTEDVSAGCIAAIALLIAAILGLMVAFWWASWIIASIAASLAIELNAAAMAGTIAASASTITTAAQATVVWGALVAALGVIFSGAVALINAQCVSTPTPSPTPSPVPTATPTPAGGGCTMPRASDSHNRAGKAVARVCA